MSGVKIYMANTINQLIDEVQVTPKTVFQKTTFVTQTTGINHYLALQLTQKNGVFANVQFMSPNELIMKVANLLGNLNSSEYSTENIRWRLFKLLNSDKFKAQFPYIANYFKEEELKRIQLATKLADLFDQYIVYRTDMIIEWQEDPVFETSKEKREDWQKWLWLEIKKQIGDNYVDKAQYQRHLLEELHSGKQFPEIEKQFSEVHIFGLTVLTKFHLELLWNLKSIIDVNFYFLNPCIGDFWYDSMSQKDLVRKWSWHKNRSQIEEYSAGNELLTAWGKVGQELFTQLFGLDDEVFSYLDYSEETKESTTLLSTIQNDIQQNVRPNEQRELIDATLIEDKSIQVTSNYTESREVEVLYNYLVDIIENNYKGDIQPHEIVVMLPDVEKYVPFIKAVFDHAPRRLPYSIGDRPANSEQSLLTVCLDVLATYSEELTSESVLKLLDYKLIRDKYRLEDIELIRNSVRDCNIKFGTKGSKNLETYLVAWEQGLMKLVMGLFMRDQTFEYEGDDFEPYVNVEGQSALQILNFVGFVRELILRASIVRKDREINDWNAYFIDLVDVLSTDVDGIEEEVHAIRKRLDSLDFINKKLDGVELSFDTYVYILQSYHKNESINDGYYRGRITFCQALPMRSIPFKIVAFLGLNAADFPRTDPEYAFDLIKMGRGDEELYKPLLGDRNTKDNDKYLFLEALLSAQDYFYMSYLGRSVKNNKVKTPSVLVDELIDYIDKYSDYEHTKDYLVKEHPLHKSSIDYLNKETQLFSYQCNNNKNVFTKVLDVVQKENQNPKIDIISMSKFYRDPIKYYYQKVLGIYFSNDELLLSEEEVFTVGKGLPEYQLKDLLINSDEINEVFTHQFKKEGVLPLRNMAQVEVTRLYEPLKELINEKNKLTQGILEDSVDVSIEFEGKSLYGQVNNVYGDNLVIVNMSKKTKLARTGFLAYLDWLLLRASGNDINLIILSSDADTVFLKSTIVTQEVALDQIGQYVSFYEKNKTELLPFVAHISIARLKSNKINSKLNSEMEYNEYLAKSIDAGIWNDLSKVDKIAVQLLDGFSKLTGVK